MNMLGFPSFILTHLKSSLCCGTFGVDIVHIDNEIVWNSKNFISQRSQLNPAIAKLLEVQWINFVQTKDEIFHNLRVIIVVTDQDGGNLISFATVLHDLVVRALAVSFRTRYAQIHTIVIVLRIFHRRVLLKDLLETLLAFLLRSQVPLALLFGIF